MTAGTVRITVEHQAARNAGTLAFLDAGAQAAELVVYEGLPPSDPQGVTTARVLARVALQKPAGTLVAGAVRLLPEGDALILATGLAGWGRVVSGAGQVAIDGECTDADGPGPFKLNALQLYEGGTVRLLSAMLG